MSKTFSVRIISLTKPMIEGVHTAEELIAYTARVSNPTNQMNNETAPKLLAYLIKHNHWSPFEMASMTLEIKTSRAIAAQILRHRSFSFQEFSQRYAQALDCVLYPARRQDNKNRQNSIDDLDQEVKDWFVESQNEVGDFTFRKYQEALNLGIAKEQARMLLPLSTETTLYMSGTIRSWIHYLQIRMEKGTQLEHREIAERAHQILKAHFPSVTAAMAELNA